MSKATKLDRFSQNLEKLIFENGDVIDPELDTLFKSVLAELNRRKNVILNDNVSIYLDFVNFAESQKKNVQIKYNIEKTPFVEFNDSTEAVIFAKKCLKEAAIECELKEEGYFKVSWIVLPKD